MRCLFVLAALLFVQNTAQAGPIYEYQSNPLAIVSGDYTTTDFIYVALELDSLLLPSQPLSNIGFRTQTFIATDGHNTFLETTPDIRWQFILSTDSTGAIDAWKVSVSRHNDSQYRLATCSDAGSQCDVEDPVHHFDEAEYGPNSDAYSSNNAGDWRLIPDPPPPSSSPAGSRGSQQQGGGGSEEGSHATPIRARRSALRAARSRRHHRLGHRGRSGQRLRHAVAGLLRRGGLRLPDRQVRGHQRPVRGVPERGGRHRHLRPLQHEHGARATAASRGAAARGATRTAPSPAARTCR